ncbi:MAG: hypothetical protein K2L82_15035 [Lachnospiraceae bacterium]|nr:hypothetical protein [Lachnospiraceae bacterium]
MDENLRVKSQNKIHIWGETWSGKTQFLKLISDRVYSYKYIDLDKNNMNCGIEDIKEEVERYAKAAGN